MIDQNKTVCISRSYFPDGQPVPDLLTEAEAIIFLRLDIDGPANPKQTLKYYRDQGLLKATQIGRHLRYQRTELLHFLDKMTDKTNRRPA